MAPTDDDGQRLRMATTFTIGFPRQQLSGTYTIQLGPNIQDEFGDGMDATGSAGVDVVRGVSQNGPTTADKYTAADVPKTIPARPDRPDGQAIPGRCPRASSCPTASSSRGTRPRPAPA